MSVTAIPKLPKPLGKSYIRPMTITAGFKLEHGILVCADTEVTVGDFKFGSSKIIKEDIGDTKLVFAIAGSVDHATTCVQQIIKIIRQSKKSQDDIEQIIIERVEDTYTRLLYPHPAANYPNSPFFDLIIGILAEGRLRLLATSETAVNEISTYQCKGIGLNLAKYLITPLYPTSKGLSEDIATRVAIRTLTYVKKYVTGCGGDSEIVILRASGEIEHLTSMDFKIQSDLIVALDDISAATFFSTSDLDIPDNEVGEFWDFWKTYVMGEREKARNRLIVQKEREGRIKKVSSSPT